ncbi:MAG: imidazole glycerol phosphate synthase subunit HisH [Coriobacteriales bacterium]|jgi:glutamine amidotransferase|nr:imidazole glycerol phosphate synthase subunit HisH [Coriobacteriales bacterium]
MAFVVVDYRKGNIRSVQKGLELAGAQALISEDAHAIAQADAIVLPGVGSFADAAAFMRASGQLDAIRASIARGVPFLGICLGLHLLLERGEEGVPAPNSREVPDASWAEGIGAISGYVRRLDSQTPDGRVLKVPHVGWNQVRFTAEGCAEAVGMAGAPLADRTASVPSVSRAALETLFAGIPDGANFYFTHSYQGVPVQQGAVLATVTHATTFPCVINTGVVFGVQFHPEKSSHNGLRVLRNFVGIVRNC